MPTLTTSQTELLEQRLCKTHERSYARLFGSASAGLVCLLRALGLKGKGVAIPAGICVSVPLAIELSGNHPVYIDISESNWCLNPSELEVCSREISAVLAVYSYGYLCDIEKLAEICAKKGWVLIEDFALSQGGRCGGKQLGSYGQASFTSFGRGKVIDVGHGGVIFSDDAKLMEEVAALEKKLTFATEQDQLFLENLSRTFTHLYNTYFADAPERIYERYLSSRVGLASHFLSKFDPSYCEPILAGLNSIDENLSHRRGMVELFNRLLSGIEGVSLMHTAPEAVHWRFNLLMSDRRDEFLQEQLQRKAKISSWYPPITTYLLPVTDWPKIPVSTRIGRQIINLWVNQDVDRSYAEEMARRIRAWVERS